MQLKRFFLVSLLCGISPAQEDTLDLTKVNKTPPSGTIGRGSGSDVFASGMTYERLPLALMVREVIPAEAVYGSEVMYVVAIKNTGLAPVAFPWSGEPDFGAEPRPVQISAFLTVLWQGSVGELDHFHTDSLWGAAEVKGSVKTMRPQQEVLIRGRARLSMLSSDAANAFVRSLPQRGSLKVRLRFAKGAPVPLPLPIVSDNAVPFLIKRPP